MTLDTEDIDGSSGGLYSKLITRKYETAGTGTLAGRPAGSMIGDSSDPDADYDLTYAYDAAGRLETIAGTGLPAGGVKYTRLTNSELIEKYRVPGRRRFASAGHHAVVRDRSESDYKDQEL